MSINNSLPLLIKLSDPKLADKYDILGDKDGKLSTEMKGALHLFTSQAEKDEQKIQAANIVFTRVMAATSENLCDPQVKPEIVRQNLSKLKERMVKTVSDGAKKGVADIMDKTIAKLTPSALGNFWNAISSVGGYIVDKLSELDIEIQAPGLPAFDFPEEEKPTIPEFDMDGSAKELENDSDIPRNLTAKELEEAGLISKSEAPKPVVNSRIWSAISWATAPVGRFIDQLFDFQPELDDAGPRNAFSNSDKGIVLTKAQIPDSKGKGERSDISLAKIFGEEEEPMSPEDHIGVLITLEKLKKGSLTDVVPKGSLDEEMREVESLLAPSKPPSVFESSDEGVVIAPPRPKVGDRAGISLDDIFAGVDREEEARKTNPVLTSEQAQLAGVLHDLKFEDSELSE